MFISKFTKIKKRLKGFKTQKKKVAIFLLLSVLIVISLGFGLYYQDKIFPRVRVADIDVSGKTEGQALDALTKSIAVPEKITLIADDQEFDLSLQEIDFSYDYQKSVNLAFQSFRSKYPIVGLVKQLLRPNNKKDLDLVFEMNQDKLNEYVSVISEQVSIEPVYPFVFLEKEVVFVNKGDAGEHVIQDQLKNSIVINLSKADFSPIFVAFTTIDPRISDQESNLFLERANGLVNKSVVLKHEQNIIPLAKEQILSVLEPNNSFDEKGVEKIVDSIKSSINREPQNAVFTFNGGRVLEFLPAADGYTVNEDLLTSNITETLTSLENSSEEEVVVNVPVQVAPPQITTEQVNDLGIKELIGKGSSRFRGSIASRIHNISLASSKFNGVLIAPNEIFSFNDVLGDVSEFTGYKQAYVIRDGKTILGDGGGVCQVSTTIFRAALEAGLPILERRAHSYRVGYYEQDSKPGFDATVYSPTTNLKFRNNTPGHILIQTIFNSSTRSLSFEFYGTGDGRIAKTTKPTVTDVTPPPEDLYIDDPSLPSGTIKQIDYKAWGAKVKFYYSVEKDGEIYYQKTFHSNFEPWQAKFLRGTGAATTQ